MTSQGDSTRPTAADWRVWQDAQVATKFAEARRASMPGAATQFEVLCDLLPARSEDVQSVRVLDIGCGDGILLEVVLRQWPGAQGVALDGSAPMLERAAERLAVFHPSAVTFIHTDFNQPQWVETLPVRAFDAVVSGFAIHHSEDARKREIYQEVFHLLKPGGVFVNIEHVASASPFGEELFDRAYARNIVRARREKGHTAVFEDVLHELRTRPDKAANRLAPVENQAQWLRAIGYERADCYWKHYELAILAGYKPEDAQD